MQSLAALMVCKCLPKLPKRAWCRSGQATVEFAVVMFAFLALIAGLGALANFGESGALYSHAYDGASHHVGGKDSGAWADVFAY